MRLGGFGGLASGLEAEQRAESALAGARHERGLGSVVLQGIDGEIRLRGGGESVLGVEVGANDLGGEFGLGGVRGPERDCGRNGAFVADGAGLGRIGGRRREVGAEGGIDLVAGERGWGAGDRIHDRTVLCCGMRTEMIVSTAGVNVCMDDILGR
jgi:hypothetical protein